MKAAAAGLYSAPERDTDVREFLYGIVLGAAAMYCFQYFDAPGMLTYLNSATQAAVQSTHGYSH